MGRGRLSAFAQKKARRAGSCLPVSEGVKRGRMQSKEREKKIRKSGAHAVGKSKNEAGT